MKGKNFFFFFQSSLQGCVVVLRVGEEADMNYQWQDKDKLVDLMFSIYEPKFGSCVLSSQLRQF